MKINIIAVGHKMPSWITTGCHEYTKRMPREMTVEIIEIKPDKRASGKNGKLVREAEAKRILDAVGDDYLVACDEKGKQVTTLKLAELLKSWQLLGQNISIVIGGADGLDEKIKQKAAVLLALSQLTLPHAFARLLLCEQLYRAYSVLQNHPYHRE